MSKELSSENYHKKDEINDREAELIQKWKDLIDSLEKKKRTLTGFSELLGMFRELETIQAKLSVIEVSHHVLFTHYLCTILLIL